MVCASLVASPQARSADIVDTAVQAGSFKTLATALTQADLIDTLKGPGPFTVFAPTDEAFAKLPTETVQALLKPENKSQLASILTYHVVPGSVMAKQAFGLDSAASVNGQRIKIKGDLAGLMVNDAKVVTTDIQCDNGVIHVIDSVILPADRSLVQTASDAGTFSTLLAAAKAAGLADTLATQGPFTVFAPTDDAFAKLPAGTVESLLKPENKDKLVEVLKYHVVSGRVYSDQAVKANVASTLQGASVNVSVSGGGAMVNQSKLLNVDLDASNGVIHVIDSVMMPPPAAPSSTDVSVVPAAVHAASPHDVLRQAINQGVPVFNAGDHDGCAQIYMQTLQGLMISPLDASMKHHIQSVLTSASHTHCPTQRAWTLRRGIDQMQSQLVMAR